MGSNKQRGKQPRAKKLWRDHAHAVVDYVFVRLAWFPAVGGIAFSAFGALFLAVVGLDDARLEQLPWIIEQRGALLVWGIFLSLAGIACLVIVELARRRADGLKSVEGAELQVAMTDAVQPVLLRLTELVARPSTHYAEQLPKVISAVLIAMPILFRENPKLRMVIYRYEPGAGKRRRRLSVVDHVGRARHKPREFVDGDGGRGKAALAWLETREPKFIPDIEKEDDPAWQGSGRGYATFISAPICSNGSIYGMITLDAPTPGDLDETDVPMLTTLASLLAVAYAAKR